MFYKVFIFSVLIPVFANAQTSIILNTSNATVWLPQQTITGRVTNASMKKIKWHLNNASGFAVVHSTGNFNFMVTLKSKTNALWVEDINHSITSDTIQYILGYKPLPEVIPFAVVNKNDATLNLKIINNPYNTPLSFKWRTIKTPAPVSVQNSTKQKANAHIPSMNGDYFFTVTIYADNDSVVYTTFVSRNDKTLHAFNFEKEYAAWIDSAIIYEITPYVFTHEEQYTDIEKKLPELKELGINTIWLQPVYKTHDGGQGYDVTDYFSLRNDLGTEQQLQQLIETAKKLNLRVLFDFVPNHTSIFHEYAKEVKQLGKQSHYYNFYQHTNDNAKYSSLYNIDSNGFVHYFWNDLVNLDYANAEVRQWILEGFKFWLRKFDIDGFRIDAAWAYNARDTSFGKQLQTSLKSIKPDILLLAEDKGALHSVYKQGYDAAYDWQADTGWISHWSWATDYSPHHNPTIFNYYNEEKRSALLDKSLFTGDTTHLRLRFLENNDQQRFITEHGKARTKIAAAILFSLPGLPLIYNGQEIGFERKLYSDKAIFKTNESIQSRDTNNLFPWYKKLCSLRIAHEALRSNNMEALPVNDKRLYALHRWQNSEHIIMLSNLSNNDATAEVNIRSIRKEIDTDEFVDLITGEEFSANKNAASLNIQMEKYSTRLLLAVRADSIIAENK